MHTLTLKNVPQELVDRLKLRAKRNRRSLNQEAIACLELTVRSLAPEDILAKADAFREGLAAKGVWVKPEDVDRWINEGRE